MIPAAITSPNSGSASQRLSQLVGERPLSVPLQPPLQLAYGNQPHAPSPYQTQLRLRMPFEAVEAHPERGGGLGSRERDAGNRRAELAGHSFYVQRARLLPRLLNNLGRKVQRLYAWSLKHPASRPKLWCQMVPRDPRLDP